jgi:hypothetical protein
MALALLAVVASFALAVSGFVYESHRREEAFCSAIEDNRAGLQNLIDVVLVDDQAGRGGEVNLDAIPEFQAVDPEVQALIRVLVNPPSRDPDADGNETPGIIERLRTYQKTLDLPVEGC